jgi:ADP-L-glycero-D-manno-heptose 6-epimerase
VLHIGACSSTTLQDEQYFQENNFEYSRDVAEWAIRHHARFIYASSAATYGDGSNGYKDDDASTRACKPLNLYGESKQKFDLWILDRGWQDKVVGLKFFNVFGPNEYHKGEMRSVIAKAYDRVVTEGKMGLFKSYTKEYAHGDQMRDFIYIKDVVDVIMHFVDYPHLNGIFNVGTGQARTWNDLARAVFSAVGKATNIEYIDMPEVLRDKYQNFTQADVTKLRKAGYAKPFTSLESAIKDYAGYLSDHRYL